MEITETAQTIIQYGGTTIMAVLFIWIFIKKETKYNKIDEDNNKMLTAMVDSNKTLTESNNNIAKALDIISNNLLVLDKKVDLIRKQCRKNERTKSDSK